ncbi:E3 ubiquitin-protein ligase TRIM11-like [Arapaima gigas]
MEEHNSHRTVSVQTERARKQKFLGKLQFEIQKKTEEKSIKLTAVKNKVDFLRNFAQSEISDVEKILMDLNRSVDRIRGELLGGIMEKQAAMEARGQELISQLEAEVMRLQERQAGLEAQATSEDHIGFLQNFQNALEPLETDVEKHRGDDMELPLHLEIVKRALQDLQERLDDVHVGEVQSENSSSLSESPSMLSLQGTRRKERSLRVWAKHSRIGRFLPEDVSLNPMTAYPFLIVSEDCKQVKRGEKIKLNSGGGSQRYDVWSCILAKEGFTSGRHYWEVTVGDNKDWKLGVVRESAPRKGLFDMSPRIGYYVLWWSVNQLRVLTSPLTKVRAPNRLRRVGIYIDCEEGLVVFYNAKTGSVVHMFSGEEFSEKMLPLFGTGDRDVPLVLSTAESQIPE